MASRMAVLDGGGGVSGEGGRSGSLPASVANLAKVAVGAGLLTVPFAFKEAGVGGALCILVGCVVLQVCSLAALSSALRRAGFSAGARGYAGLAGTLLGPKIGDCVDVVQSLCNFGAFVSFLQICGSEVGSLSTELSPYLQHEVGFEACRAIGLWALTLIVVMPLACMRTMNALRFSSALGLVCIAFVLVVVVVSFIAAGGIDATCDGLSLGDDAKHSGGGQGGNGHGIRADGGESFDENPTIWSESVISTTRAATIIAFGFINQVQYVPILLEMRRPTPARTWLLIVGATAVCFGADVLIGAFGYLTFCSATENCILDNYDVRLGGVYLAARASFMVSLLITCPLVIFPVREAVVSYFTTRRKTTHAGNGVDTSTRLLSTPPPPKTRIGGATPMGPGVGEKSPLIIITTESDVDEAGVARNGSRRAVRLRLVTTAGIVLAGVTIASLVKRLDTVVGIVGALGGGILMYTVPAAVALSALRGADPTNRMLSSLRSTVLLAMGGFGILLSVAGTSMQFIR